MNAIINYFYRLTDRNWGAPWHFIGVCLATQIFIEIAGIKIIWQWSMGLYTIILVHALMGYEIWQKKKEKQSTQGMMEDMLFNTLGYLAACIPLVRGSYEDLILAMPLIITTGRPLICLDPGHGGKFTGAAAGGYLEKDINFRYAHRISNILAGFGMGTIFTRTSVELYKSLSKDLQARADFANENEADLFLSLHCNAAKDIRANGFEVWTSPGPTRSDGVAEYIYNEVAQVYPDLKLRMDLLDDDKDKEADFKVLTATRMPAVLIELGFITNTMERDLLVNWQYTENLSLAISRGIWRAFNDIAG